MASAIPLGVYTSAKKMKGASKMMKIFFPSLVAVSAVLTSAVPALAGSFKADTGSSLLMLLFLGFVALIVVFQLVPAGIMLATRLKELRVAKVEPGNGFER